MREYQQKTDEDLEKVVQLISSAPDEAIAAPSSVSFRSWWIVAIIIAIVGAAFGTWMLTKPTCNVKAVNRPDGRYYYMPTDPYYSAVKISGTDKMVCSEKEAIEGGWKRKHFPKSALPDQ